MRFLILVSFLVTSVFCFADDSTAALLIDENAVALSKINEIKVKRQDCLRLLENKNSFSDVALCIDESRRPMESVLIELINAKMANVKKFDEASLWARKYLHFKNNRIQTVTKIRDDNLGSTNVKVLMYEKHIEITENFFDLIFKNED